MNSSAKEANRVRAQESYVDRKQEINDRARKWKEDNPDRYRETHNAAYYRRRAYWAQIVDTYKMDRGCESCGYAEHPSALDLDHIDRSTKVMAISSLVNKLNPKYLEHQEIMQAEIAKCRVLCANCHRIKTIKESEYAPCELLPS